MIQPCRLLERGPFIETALIAQERGCNQPVEIVLNRDADKPTVAYVADQSHRIENPVVTRHLFEIDEGLEWIFAHGPNACERHPPKFVSAGQFSGKRKTCGGEETHRVCSFCLYDYLCNVYLFRGYQTHCRLSDTRYLRLRRFGGTQPSAEQRPVFGLKQLLDFRKCRMNLRF